MKRTQRGSTMLYCLMAISVLLTGSLGAAGFATSSLARANSDRRHNSALNAAQAGLEHGIALTYEAARGNQGRVVSETYNFTNLFVDIFAGGTVIVNVQPVNSGAGAWITSTATTTNGYVKSVRTFITTRDVGIWNNAIFAGTGAAGQSINGNVDIRGSVHILGEGEAYTDLNGNGMWDGAEPFIDTNGNGVWDPGEPFTDVNGDGVWNPAEPFNDSNGNGGYDPPLTQTDLNSSFSGTGHIGNNYHGIPSGLQATIPQPPRINDIETLGTEVRAKHGRISINGNATIGSSGLIAGGTKKNWVDGVFVSDGFTGNQGAASVFSDNGTNSTYDLGNLGIKFPLISGIGSEEYTDKDGGKWATQEQFLDSQSLTVPVTTITSDTNSFAYADTRGNSIQFTRGSGSTPSVLTVTGIVRFNGSLQLGDKDTIRYAGNGTLYATQDMRIDGNLLPANGLVFPTTARMGFIAKRNMFLATGNGSSQLSMAGAFYAQGRIVSQMQNQIAGTFVANHFDLGSNVPNIYQVPELSRNMPPGMPGDQAFVSMRVRTWRERQ
jgi:Tfp pilus assembly protein PilV